MEAKPTKTRQSQVGQYKAGSTPALRTNITQSNINLNYTIMRVTFNIGLNNNPFNEVQIQQFLSANREYRLIRWIKDMGEYIDNPEPTFVCEIEFPDNVEPEVLIRFTRNMCVTYTQECVPFSCDTADMLVFNPSYTGGRFKFDEKYFIRIKD